MMYLYFLISVIFIIFQGLFAGSEISFISANFLKLRYKIRKGDKQAKVAYDLISNPEKFLATTLVGTNISVIISSR